MNEYIDSFVTVIDLTRYTNIIILSPFRCTKHSLRKPGGVVVEHQTPNQEVLDSIPTGGIVLCPCARHINSL